MLKLSPLVLDEIELLRSWRNRADIVRYMEFQEPISADDQLRWFRQLNPLGDHYFMIKWNDQSVGMAHVNQVDRTLGSAQVGLLMGDSNFGGTGIALRASLQLLDFAFVQLGMLEVWAKVHTDNETAYRYNEQLGFQFKAPKGDFRYMELSLERYEAKKNALTELAELIN